MNRNLFIERSQLPMGYPHSPGANMPRVFQSSFSGLGGGCAGCSAGVGAMPRRQVSLGRALGAIVSPTLAGLGSTDNPMASATSDALAADDAAIQADQQTTDLSVQSYGTQTASPAVMMVGRVLSVAGAAIGAYHGYKRNGGSIGWAIGWSLLGGMFPVITVPVALAQGLGKRGR